VPLIASVNLTDEIRQKAVTDHGNCPDWDKCCDYWYGHYVTQLRYRQQEFFYRTQLEIDLANALNQLKYLKEEYAEAKAMLDVQAQMRRLFGNWDF